VIYRYLEHAILSKETIKNILKHISDNLLGFTTHHLIEDDLKPVSSQYNHHKVLAILEILACIFSENKLLSIFDDNSEIIPQIALAIYDLKTFRDVLGLNHKIDRDENVLQTLDEMSLFNKAEKCWEIILENVLPSSGILWKNFIYVFTTHTISSLKNVRHKGRCVFVFLKINLL